MVHCPGWFNWWKYNLVSKLLIGFLPIPLAPGSQETINPSRQDEKKNQISLTKIALTGHKQTLSFPLASAATTPISPTSLLLMVISTCETGEGFRQSFDCRAFEKVGHRYHLFLEKTAAINSFRSGLAQLAQITLWPFMNSGRTVLAERIPFPSWRKIWVPNLNHLLGIAIN